MTTTDIVALSILGFLFALQLFYWAFFMFRLRSRPRNIGASVPDVSVVVCAKNEDANLERLIPALLAQKYGAKKQIVIVDDCSSDNTPIVIARFREQYPEVYTTTIPFDKKFKHGKKLAISVGIKAARYEHMVFIDADCMPASDTWLANVCEQYSNNTTELVIGYGKYAKHGGLLNLMIRYETFWNAVQYLGFALALKPFMGVGRNISYKRSLYERSSKYRRNIALLSGDDDLFVSEMGTRKNTAIVYSHDSQTISEPERTWLAYSAQKSRHLTTANLYPAVVKFWLVVELMSRTLFWLASIVAVLYCLLFCYNEILLWTAVGLFAVRTLIIYISLALSAKRMNESKMWLLALPFDILIPCMQLLAWFTGVATQSRNTWK